jgi:hypothetical protein
VSAFIHGQCPWSSAKADKKVKGRIEKLTHNHLPQEKNWREGHEELSEEENTQNLPVH